jgi:hypothetical protein
MADLSKITVGGTEYNVKDAEARSRISALENYTDYLGVTSTPLTDGASTNPITVDGESVTAKNGNIANYGSKEFIFNGSVWQEFGDLSGLGSLAFKNSASGSFTPTGNVSKPNVTVTPSTDTIQPVSNVGTPASFTVSGEELIITAGSAPTLGSAKTFMTGASAELAAAPAFTGTAGTVTVS